MLKITEKSNTISLLGSLERSFITSLILFFTQNDNTCYIRTTGLMTQDYQPEYIYIIVIQKYKQRYSKLQKAYSMDTMLYYLKAT